MSSAFQAKTFTAQRLCWVITVLVSMPHLGEAGSSSARLVLRLISYENPANLKIIGAQCDFGSSLCDPTFDVTAVWGGPDIRVTSPCLSNIGRVNFSDERASPPELVKPVISQDGPMPSWAVVRINVKDCFLDKVEDSIADFVLNVTASNGRVGAAGNANDGSSELEAAEGQLATLPSAMDGSGAAVLEMKRVRSSPDSIRMKISVWVQCSPGYYGSGCDKQCEPTGRCCCDSGGNLRCGGAIDCSAQLAAKLTASADQSATTPRGGSNNGGNGNSVDHKDEAASVMFIAVMASSMTSICILAIIALVAIKMCKASESNALIIHRLVSQDASSLGTNSQAALDFRRQQSQYQLQSQHMGYFNPASYNTLTSPATILSTINSATPVTTNRTDSGVYEDPTEPPAADAEPPAPPLPERPQEEVQRMPQSKSYSRKA